MMKGVISCLLLVVAVVVSEAATAKLREISMGKCPDIVNKQDFDPVPYLGTWYEIERFDAEFQEGMDCVQLVYSDLGDGLVEVHNMARTAEGEFTEIIGTAVVKEPGVLLVEFDGYTPGEYHVLDTDYTTFSAVFSCIQVGSRRLQYAWVLSRDTTIDQETHDHARQVFQNNGIDLSSFHSTYQGDGCPYSA